MQLCYRGINYKSTKTKIETIPSGIYAQFLGKTYIIYRPITVFKSKLELRKYRGISYIK